MFKLPTMALVVLAVALIGAAPSSFGLYGVDPLESADAVAEFHFELRTSAPMADSTVTPTSIVKLMFTQKPQDAATQIRVMKGEVRVPSGDVMQNPDDDKEYSVSFEQPLSPGAYQVLWRSMAADGHVVDGEFGFAVAVPGA